MCCLNWHLRRIFFAHEGTVFLHYQHSSMWLMRDFMIPGSNTLLDPLVSFKFIFSPFSSVILFEFGTIRFQLLMNCQLKMESNNLQRLWNDDIVELMVWLLQWASGLYPGNANFVTAMKTWPPAPPVFPGHTWTYLASLCFLFELQFHKSFLFAFSIRIPAPVRRG